MCAYIFIIYYYHYFRVSAPFFYEADLDALIEPLPQLVGDGNPAKYKPVIYGEHLLSKVSSNFTFQQKE